MVVLEIQCNQQLKGQWPVVLWHCSAVATLGIYWSIDWFIYLFQSQMIFGFYNPKLSVETFPHNGAFKADRHFSLELWFWEVGTLETWWQPWLQLFWTRDSSAVLAGIWTMDCIGSCLIPQVNKPLITLVTEFVHSLICFLCFSGISVTELCFMNKGRGLTTCLKGW